MRKIFISLKFPHSLLDLNAVLVCFFLLQQLLYSYLGQGKVTLRKHYPVHILDSFSYRSCLLHCDVFLLLTDDKLEWSHAELPTDGQKVVLVISVLENPGQFYCYNYSADGMVLPVCLFIVLQSIDAVLAVRNVFTFVCDSHADHGRVVHCSDEAL